MLMLLVVHKMMGHNSLSMASRYTPYQDTELENIFTDNIKDYLD